MTCMAIMIRGTDVTLYERVQTGVDPFGAPIYAEAPVIVHNVLVTPVSADAAPDSTNMAGKRQVYELSIPKGDEHTWSGSKVSVFGDLYLAVSPEKAYQEELLPLDWNKKVQVERYV